MTEQVNQERYPAVTVQDTLPLPAAPDTMEEALQYLRVLHNVLADNQIELAAVVNELAYHRSTVSTPVDAAASGGTGDSSPASGVPESMPPPVGSGVFHASADATEGVGRLFVDLPTTGTWLEIASPVFGVVGWPTGVEDDFRDDTTFDFVDATRTFTLEVNADVEYWVKGVKYKLASGANPSIVLNEARGNHRIYLKADGTLGDIDTWDFDTLLKDNCYICSIHLEADGSGTVSTDFESDTLGALPSGFSHLFGTAGTWEVETGNWLGLDAAAIGQTQKIIWDDAGDLEDCIWTGRFMRGSSAQEIGLWVRHTGDPENDGYLLYIGTNYVVCYKYENGSNTGTIWTTTGLTIDGSTWYNFKLETIGTTIRFKYWTGTEPGTWTGTGTDSTFTSGYCVISNHGAASAARLDDFLIESDDLVAGLSYESLYIGNERHDLMNPMTHRYLHNRFGAYIESGLGLTDITADGNGNLDAHATIGVASGVLVDEDLWNSISTQATPAQIPVFYMDGSTPVLARATVTSAPVYKGSNRLYFNELVGGAWKLTEVASNNNFVYYWILATNDPDQPIISVMGQAEYGNISAARSAAENEVASIVSLLDMEEFHFIGGLLYKTSTAMSNTWAAAIVSDADGNDYYDLRSAGLGSGSPPTSHAGLSDRDLPGQHPDSSISLSGTHTLNLAGATDLDDAMTVLDDLTLGDLTGNDSDIALSGSPYGTASWLSGMTHVNEAMDLLSSFQQYGFHGLSGNFDGGAFFTFDTPSAGTPRTDIQFVYFDVNGRFIQLGQQAPSLAYLDELRIASPMVMLNNTAIGSWDSGVSTIHNIAHLTAGDVLVIGETGGDASIASSLSTDLNFWNTKGISGLESGGTSRVILVIGSGDDVQVGNANNQLSLIANGTISANSALVVPNNVSYKAEESGGTARAAAYMNGSNQLVFGSTTNKMILRSNGTIDAQSNNIETTGDITASEVDTDRLMASREKTLAAGGNTFAWVYCAAGPSSCAVTIHYEVEAKDATDVQNESGEVTFVMTRDSSDVQSGSFTKSGTVNVCSAGTLTVTPVANVATTGILVARFTIASTGLSSPTYKANLIAIGNADRAVTWV